MESKTILLETMDSGNPYNESLSPDFGIHNVLSLTQFDKKSLEKIFNAASDFKPIQDKKDLGDVLKGKIIALLFFEPSTRTRGSFETAIKYLGGQTILVENPQNTSVAKGETLEDTGRVFSFLCDAIVMRHPQEGSVKRVADVVDIPVINAGDGTFEHPTQALLDLFTIKEKTGKLEGLKGLIAGDLKNGRTVHSLLQGLSLYKNNKVYLLSTPSLKLNPELKHEIENKGVTLNEIEKVTDIPKDCDFWYWTRVQKERFANEEDYRAVKNNFILNKDLLNKYAGEKTILMHPLPRVGEIAEEVDSDLRALYFREQIPNGLYVRMALLTLILNS